MKNTILVLMVMVAMASCKKKEVEPNAEASQFIGIWESDKFGSNNGSFKLFVIKGSQPNEILIGNDELPAIVTGNTFTTEEILSTTHTGVLNGSVLTYCQTNTAPICGDYTK